MAKRKNTDSLAVSSPLWADESEIKEDVSKTVKAAKNENKTNKNKNGNSRTYKSHLDGRNSSDDDNFSDNRNKNEKNSKVSDRKESKGAQNTGKKSKGVEQSNDKHSASKPVRKVRNSNDTQDSSSKIGASAKGRASCRENDKGNASSGIGTERKGCPDSRCNKGSGTSKRGVSKCTDGTEESKRKTRQLIENDDEDKQSFSKYPKGEFERGSKMIRPTPYIRTPKKFSDDTLAEIILNEKRYVVSKWSLIDGLYIQGLDSHFIVNKLIISNKKNK